MGMKAKSPGVVVPCTRAFVGEGEERGKEGLKSSLSSAWLSSPSATEVTSAQQGCLFLIVMFFSFVVNGKNGP